jgi:hypothetical protein
LGKLERRLLERCYPEEFRCRCRRPKVAKPKTYCAGPFPTIAPIRGCDVYECRKCGGVVRLVPRGRCVVLEGLR